MSINGMWCSGSTSGLGPFSPSSTLGIPTPMMTGSAPYHFLEYFFYSVNFKAKPLCLSFEDIENLCLKMVRGEIPSTPTKTI
jgi:hypothetical protein